MKPLLEHEGASRSQVDRIGRHVLALTADRGGYNLFAYALAILLHIYNSLINMRYLHILPHI